MTLELADIRKQIDSIDDQVHDLLMRRASLVSSVAAAKKKEGLQVVQPAREARMIRRLLLRHKGPLPQATIVRIWRELVGSVSLLQTGLSVAVAAQGGQTSNWDMAQNYFGSAVPMKKLNGNPHTVSAIAEDEASFGVLPWPEQVSIGAWWVHLFDPQSQPISIICALPYGTEKKDEFESHPRALVISKIDFMPSDQDISFIGIKCSTNISKAKLFDYLIKSGFEPMGTYSAHSQHDESHYYLCEVEGFVGRGDHKITALKAIFGDVCLYCESIGGYPDIPELKKPMIG